MIPTLALVLLTIPAPAPGDQLKPFVVETRTGVPFAWKPGRTTVVCLCALWCDTWKDQLPRLSRARSALRGLPVDYLAVSIDGRWLERTDGTQVASLLADPGGAWTSSIGIDRVPYTLVVDPSGVIRWSAHGVLRCDDIVSQVRLAIRPHTTGPVYLTFDGVTDELLDVLRTEGVKATFFCQSGLKGPVVERARREGHSVQGVTPGGSRYYRASGSAAIHTGTGIAPFFIDDPFDLTRPGTKELKRRVLNNARPRAVVYLHAEVTDTQSALPEIIQNLRSRGFTFESLR